VEARDNVALRVRAPSARRIGAPGRRARHAARSATMASSTPADAPART